MTAQFFASAADLRDWFERNHESAPELFVGYWKKGTGQTGVSHPEAIEQALCFGWIDSVARRIDERSYQVRFTPRRPGSVWSAVNVAKIAELTVRGQMRPRAPAPSNYANPIKFPRTRMNSLTRSGSPLSRPPGSGPNRQPGPGSARRPRRIDGPRRTG